MPKTYVIFAPLCGRGVYYTWDRCKAVLEQCRGMGQSFASFKTEAEARSALRAGSLKAYKKSVADRRLWMDPSVKLPCLVVDAACSGAPGPVEYRGVVLPEGYEVFRQGPFPRGTNNIGEFLAIVSGLRWLESYTLPFPLYSDSSCAIGWVMGKGECNTTLENIGPDLKAQIARAESWLRGPTAPSMKNRVLKWDTARLGEIPADYDRK